MGASTAALREGEELDRAVYGAIATVPTPTLDRVLGRLSHAADHGVLWFMIAGAVSARGGEPGRRAARLGVTALGLTSAVVNLAVKPLARRERPDRVGLRVPLARHVPMPRSRSFPSGHSASAFAFATAAAHELPLAGLPLRALAAVVAYSRVHTGVHYPGDVVVGSLIGSTVAGTIVALRAAAERRRRT
jgi:undecaprenyl-diphosphatase